MAEPTAAHSSPSARPASDEQLGQTVEQPSPRPSHKDPETIGPYRIIQKIGEGGMGVVYKAEQREPVRRTVALKVIKLGMDTSEVVARFEAERQALALMSHPHVAKVFEAGMTEQGRPYFAMEFVPGVPLTQYCDDNKLTTRERLELFIPVCQAVQHAHQKGIIHRDLKPTNILICMFDSKPVPKVIDFGVAKAANQALTQKTLFTQTGALIGTPEYMSPEQAQTSGLDVDTRTDIYSLGVILYELLTGQLPFDAQMLRTAGLEGMARIIRETEPPKPSTRLTLLERGGASAGAAPIADAARKRRSDPRALQRELRGDLDWITLKAMEKDRTRRYETANGLAVDVQRYLDNEPIFAHPPSTIYRLGKMVRKHKVGFAATAAIFLALLLGVISTTFEMLRARALSVEALQAQRTAVEQRQLAEQQRAAALENEARADSSIAHILKAKGDLAAAEPMYRRALAVYQQLRGHDHVDVAAAMGDLASLLQSKGDRNAAEQTARDSLAMYQRLRGEEDPLVAGGYEKLGAVLMASDKTATAAEALRRSIQIYRRAKTPDAQGLAAATGDLGLLLVRTGNAAAAEPLLRESMDRWMTVPGYERVLDHDLATIAQTLSGLFQQRHDGAGAARYTRQYLLIQIAHISMGLEASPNDVQFLWTHAQFCAMVGRFGQAMVDYDKIIQVIPADPVPYMQSACAHLYHGDTARYRELCRRMLDRFGNSTDPRTRDKVAKTCLLAPAATDDPAALQKLARANVAQGAGEDLAARYQLAPGAPQDLTALYQLCDGMAEYRSGDFQRSVEMLEKSVASGLRVEPRATALSFEAMAKHRLHQDEQAKADLDRAHALLEKEIARPDADIIQFDSTVQDWLICQIARREADELIIGQHPAPATREVGAIANH